MRWDLTVHLFTSLLSIYQASNFFLERLKKDKVRKKDTRGMGLFSSRKAHSGFSGSNTAEEVTRGIDATALTAIITGASSGIGSETERILALRGVHVVIAVRNMSKGQAVKEAIMKENSNAKVDVMEINLSSMASVRKFASEFKSLNLPLNILINNAGVATYFKLSQDNIEMMFATNHLETMKSTADQSNIEGRIINVSSNAHKYSYNGGILFDNISDESRFNIMWAYAQSKLANVLHANELARRLKEEGVLITSNSLTPGAVETNIFRDTILSGIATSLGKYFLKTVQQGASTTCYVALHPNVKGVNGEYFRNNNISESNSKAQDTELSKKLWDFSIKLCENNGNA
ncbi:short-chain dehydrogenase TIC 32, chloroplastic-like isoform X2 [Papaver somniferum]|uniref:short-chain dehydrogenase TIC 32, chloroplastic-like isoform X2 n=1 Tax=Papaver somniferum TaxID=3469 RepID=UPI000E705157|nr:short-chain dehydrogenase TIC 32, chloroplastic-like isoform X2 [Papaver somniferum]